MSDQKNAKDFVDRLASDDAFRDEVERDPVAAAGKYGFKIDPASLPAGGVTLPPKHVFEKHADALAQRFHQACEVIIFFKV